MGSLEQLYQQVILDHAREKHGEGDPSGMDASSHQVNPTCGDEVTLGVSMDGEHLVSIQWDGDGCSISRASLSMMTDLTEGKSADEIARLYRDMEVMMHSRNLGVMMRFSMTLVMPPLWSPLRNSLTALSVPSLDGTRSVMPWPSPALTFPPRASPLSSKGTAMSNPMAQSEPVEQRFGVAGASEEAVSTAPTRQIDGTDVVEQGTLAAENVLEAMKDVIDPELGINIVDLGLVYGIVIGPQNEVRLDMTLTSAACPLTDVIERQAQTILSSITDEVQINWVWMPPWGPDRITPDGREQLRAIGFNV